MPSAEPVMLASVVASLSSLAAQALGRLRLRCVPDSESGQCRVSSACSDVPLEHRDDNELRFEEFDLGGKKVVCISAKE